MRVLDKRRFPLAWAAAVLVLGSLSVLAGVPTLWSPLSLVTVMPGFLLGSTPLNSDSVPFRDVIFTIIVALPVTLWFCLWVLPPSARTERIPRRSVVLLAAVVLLSVPYFISSWEYGQQYQGAFHTRVMIIYNIIFAVLATLSWFRNRRTPRVSTVTAFHGIVFCWLAWCAFPYLGELP